MSKGIGCDIIEIARIRANLDKYGEKFLDKILTVEEKKYCLTHRDLAPSVAGRFSGKEAIAKALGSGFGEKLSFHDIEILNDAQGKPHVHLSSRALERFDHPNLQLSISHCKSHAVAFVIWID